MSQSLRYNHASLTRLESYTGSGSNPGYNLDFTGSHIHLNLLWILVYYLKYNLSSNHAPHADHVDTNHE